MYQARLPCLLTTLHIEATETSLGAPVSCLDSLHMRTETTYPSSTVGIGTSEVAVPEGLRKLGRLAVWAISGSQFIDLIWCEVDDSNS
jgi:hypothetical protein